MELHILMGRACAGKSRRVLEEITARRSQQGQVLLVPEHASHEAELDLCRVCGPTASRDAEVLSFPQSGHPCTGPHRRAGGRDAGRWRQAADHAAALQEVSGRLTVFARPLPAARVSCGSWWRWRTSCMPTRCGRRRCCGRWRTSPAQRGTSCARRHWCLPPMTRASMAAVRRALPGAEAVRRAAGGRLPGGQGRVCGRILPISTGWRRIF